MSPSRGDVKTISIRPIDNRLLKAGSTQRATAMVKMMRGTIVLIVIF